MDQTVIVIAGMHRSGTSLTASLLERSGLKIGESLLSNGFDNKKGHFEDLEFLKIHEEDLKAKSIDSRGLSGDIKPHFTFEEETLETIYQLLSSKKNVPLWGWKEPRTTLYLRSWKLIIPHMKSIAVFRHYDEVAASLIRRYKYKLYYGIHMSPLVRLKHFLIFPIHILMLRREAYRSWYIYNRAILDFKAKYEKDMILLELNHLTTNYNEIVGRINSQLNIVLTKIQVDEIIEHSLLTKGQTKGFKLRFFSKKKLNDVLAALNENSLWI